jgi:hypothetical protein
MPLKNPDIDTGRNEKPSRSDGMRAPASFKDPIRGKQPDSFFTVGGSQDISAKIDRAARHASESEPVTMTRFDIVRSIRVLAELFHARTISVHEGVPFEKALRRARLRRQRAQRLAELEAAPEPETNVVQLRDWQN